MVKGATRLRGEKRRNIREVEVDREQRRDLGRKGNSFLIFFLCEKLFLAGKYDVLVEGN